MALSSLIDAELPFPCSFSMAALQPAASACPSSCPLSYPRCRGYCCWQQSTHLRRSLKGVFSSHTHPKAQVSVNPKFGRFGPRARENNVWKCLRGARLTECPATLLKMIKSKSTNLIGAHDRHIHFSNVALYEVTRRVQLMCLLQLLDLMHARGTGSLNKRLL